MIKKYSVRSVKSVKIETISENYTFLKVQLDTVLEEGPWRLCSRLTRKVMALDEAEDGEDETSKRKCLNSCCPLQSQVSESVGISLKLKFGENGLALL